MADIDTDEFREFIERDDFDEDDFNDFLDSKLKEFVKGGE